MIRLQTNMSSSEENETVSQQKQLKEQLVSLNREELLRLRSTPGHYECVRLLKIGCPESYEELLSLLQDLAGDVNSKSSVNLENNKRKVQLISDGLQKSEVFHRQGDWKTAYKARESLALCFSEHDEDIDLAKHFFISCLTMCLEQPDSERKTRAFVYQNLGLLDERAGNFQSALTHLETAAELAKTVPCMGKGGKTLLYREIAGQCHQVCLTLGSLVKKGDASGPLFYYYKALDHALVAKDKKAEAKAHYKISLEYLEEGMNYQLAEEHLKKYKKLCQETDDLEGLCQAHHGLATIQERQGNRGAALKVLKECLKKTEELDESKSLEMLAISNVKLGILYTSMGNHEQAMDHYNKAYQLSCQQWTKKGIKPEDLELRRVLCGVGRAHCFYPQFLTFLCTNDVHTLLKWKCLRQGFSVYEPELLDSLIPDK